MNYIPLKNNQCVQLSSIPQLSYETFQVLNTELVLEGSERHCVNYFAYPDGEKIRLICCIADDTQHDIYVSSCIVDRSDKLASLTAQALCFEKFEREIHENYGIQYSDHPWLKPVRYSHDRADLSNTISNYPFYSIESEELHEVGVGPIHAGIIEPGHFRFICNGEQILHLEIQLGYQHRGIEKLFLEKKSLLQLCTLAENIAGDTAVGHSTAFAHVWESLCGFETTQELDFARTVALELERIAIHSGDLSALCTDIAYQLGSSVFGRLRTPTVNFMQQWCGNRLSKGLIRPCRNKYPLTEALTERLEKALDSVMPDFTEMKQELFSMPSVLSRFERTGILSLDNAEAIGAVGMAARASGLSRDIRTSHPYSLYTKLKHEPVIKHHGDVFSRVQMRAAEVVQSIGHVNTLIDNAPKPFEEPEVKIPKAPAANSFALSLVEGWRGEICHCAITGSKGELIHYKIKDPSFHNWMALALAVRNNEISDFPVCNKSFNLSYCGHDL